MARGFGTFQSRQCGFCVLHMEFDVKGKSCSLIDRTEQKIYSRRSNFTYALVQNLVAKSSSKFSEKRKFCYAIKQAADLKHRSHFITMLACPTRVVRLTRKGQ